jgi:hypothetical protein
MDMIIVTDWEQVEKNDFYLSADWLKNTDKETMKEARKLQKAGKLYIAYEVPAKSYCIYQQMDAQQIFINSDGDRVLDCEGAIIGNNHKERWGWEGESY